MPEPERNTVRDTKERLMDAAEASILDKGFVTT